MGGQGEVCLDCLAWRDCETSEAIRRYRVFPRLSPDLLQSSLDACPARLRVSIQTSVCDFGWPSQAEEPAESLPLAALQDCSSLICSLN